MQYSRRAINYLIVDWKTSKRPRSGYRQQLEAYKRAYSIKQRIPLKNLKVAIAYVGLRGPINNGEVKCELDLRQPGKTAFESFAKRVNKLLSWINKPEHFLQDFKEYKVDNMLWRAVVEASNKK